MRRRRLLWQIYPSYLLITLLSLLAVALYGAGALRSFYDDQTEADLQSTAWLLEEQIADRLLSRQPDRVEAFCNGLGEKLGERLGEKLGEESLTRITVVLPSGEVVGDSQGSPAAMGNHAQREEIKEALAGRIGSSVRESSTLEQDMMYVAIPIQREGKIIGILRTSIAVMAIDRALREIQWRIALVGLLVVMVAAGVSLLVSRRISRPLERLKAGAERFAQGDLSHRLRSGNSEEIASLAETLNQMAAELDRRIRTTVTEKNQREAILATLRHNHGHRQRSAAALGIGVRTLGLKLKKWKEQHLVSESV